jgi:DHA2 family multidrug resistance protein-like MFS transporter
MLFSTQHFQLVEGLTPLRSGLWMLVPVVVSTASVLLSPLAARRIRPAYLIGAGLPVSVLGLLVLTQVDATSGPIALVTGWGLINLGAGPLVTLGTDLVVGSASPERAGSAAALNETSGEFGFALGIATLGSIVTAIYRTGVADAIPAGVPAGAAEAARDTLAGATAAAANLPAPVATALLTPAREAFTNGMHVAAGLSAVLLLGVAVLVVTALRNVRPSGEITTEGPAAQAPLDQPAPAAV